ncbi:F0F1 ATP synthase subunit A [Cereibacter azotoformans]|uniref:ATP synthase subunit a n=2 Tax=Cereibacter TaxID=1653176 RepID=ATP6_CERS5|nr:F0F1 ATP synthase subunit A [Cereibacter azotoformans]A4WNY6.1 RecName: Full=ATP synthase subunit a; AltName: Full=ATP synthase F0 sector subunit a; AltName: Full=F-ATPase subunit 6 [Cereibacter sphaeroides ATCC 17025]AXQ92467.1 F0F1 ATP synthase subunit A [Cereibacter sphaeroides]MBO4169959.1 F0F1 ATP synthase subunit A [Cereibacter azotoformans]PTR20779.1 ATP synthase F0 subcomplex A subunit [Cereibacter azotoformans]UIJ30743.1 F0F1 ATP synthase subunit A [Cereibacter azotoformans]ULB085
METEVEHTGLAIHPMDQFIVRKLFCHTESASPMNECTTNIHWYDITNVTMWMAIAVLVIAAILVLGTRRRAIVPSRSQSVAELLYGFIHNMVEEVTGHEGVKYFPYVMTLFLFVLCGNVLGLLPLSFTTTSHMAVTVPLALMVFVGVTALGFMRNGPGFLKMFWVTSAPLAIRPVLAVIEVISYFVRPVSHSIRLAGNMMAGHAVIKVIAGFASIAVVSPVVVGAVTAIYALELLVAVVQAYVFTILTCVYLRDAVGDAHH